MFVSSNHNMSARNLPGRCRSDQWHLNTPDAHACSFRRRSDVTQLSYTRKPNKPCWEASNYSVSGNDSTTMAYCAGGAIRNMRTCRIRWTCKHKHLSCKQERHVGVKQPQHVSDCMAGSNIPVLVLYKQSDHQRDETHTSNILCHSCEANKARCPFAKLGRRETWYGRESSRKQG